MKHAITTGIIAVIITSGTLLAYLFTAKTIKPRTKAGDIRQGMNFLHLRKGNARLI